MKLFLQFLLCAVFLTRICSCQTQVSLHDIIIPSSNLTNSTLDCIRECQTVILDAPFKFGLEEAIKVVASAGLICLSALFSGLTLGLLGLDRMTLKV